MLLVRITAAMVALTLPIATASHAHAGENHRSDTYGHGQRHLQRSFYGGNGLPSYIHGLGTYADSISGVRARGNGIYFAAEGQGYSVSPAKEQSLRRRIIHVNSRTIGAECSYEAGVCVIRP